MTLINQTGITVFRAIAAIGRAVVLCNVLAFIYIAYALLFCGFIIPTGALSCPGLSQLTPFCSCELIHVWAPEYDGPHLMPWDELSLQCPR